MTTGTWIESSGDRPPVVTQLPRPGAVLVRGDEPPVVAGETCADVTPGPIAVICGDRRRGTFNVECGGDRQVVPSTDLPGVAAAVESALEEDTAVVRFGDRAACRSVLPAPTVAAVERRLVETALERRATLLTWESGTTGDADRRTYDVVVDGPAAGER